MRTLKAFAIGAFTLLASTAATVSANAQSIYLGYQSPGYGDPYNDPYNDPYAGSSAYGDCDYYTPPWGYPDDYCDYDIWNQPVYFGGSWYSGPIYYRYSSGIPYFWLNGSWRRDQWRGPRPRSFDWGRGHNVRWSGEVHHRDNNRGGSNRGGFSRGDRGGNFGGGNVDRNRNDGPRFNNNGGGNRDFGNRGDNGGNGGGNRGNRGGFSGRQGNAAPDPANPLGLHNFRPGPGNAQAQTQAQVRPDNNGGGNAFQNRGAGHGGGGRNRGADAQAQTQTPAAPQAAPSGEGRGNRGGRRHRDDE